MANLMDNTPFSSAPHNVPTQDLNTLIQQAKQNPKAFEDYVRQNNPQAYQQALQIRNSANPQAMIMQMAKQKNVNPNILRMLGIM